MTDDNDKDGRQDGGSPDSTNSMPVRARMVWRVRKVWIIPLVIPVIMIALVATIYIGSVINPIGHLHGLPVQVVDQDTGATTPTGHVNLGQSVVAGLQQAPGVTDRLKVRVVTLAQAQKEMDRGHAYATLVIPPTFTASALLDAGYPAASGAKVPSTPGAQLLENSRQGSLGVSLASGVLTPAVDQISKQIGAKLTAQSTAAVRANPVLAGQLADPVALKTVTYRPLPAKSALGLSAFYVSLIAILGGFLAGTLINSSMDGALGYSTSDLGPRWKIRVPLRISRRQTLITKWGVALVAAPLLTATILLIAVGAFGMYAPHFGLLWLMLTLTTLMVSFGTLALLAAFGSFGQLLAMVIILYLSLASSGGTIPVQALPGFFRAVSTVEPLRQVLEGSRDILYFGAQWHAGFAHALMVIGLELAFWVVLGLAFTSWYDRRKMYRVSPDVISYVEQSVAQRKMA